MNHHVYPRPHDQQTVSLHGRDWSVKNETDCD